MSASLTIGETVRARRAELGLSQEQLAALVGCCVTTIRNLERDYRRPQRRTREAIAKALGLSAALLPEAKEPTDES